MRKLCRPPISLMIAGYCALNFAGWVPAVVAAPSSAGSSSNAEPRVYAPDRLHFAFVRSSNKTVDSAQGEVSADSIWYGTTKDKSAHPLFEPGAKVDTHQPVGVIQMGNVQALNFAPDGRTLYFLSACYAVSGAVIAFDFQTKKLRYVTDANSLKVIQRGKRKGYLMVTRHRYHPQGGAYENPETMKP